MRYFSLFSLLLVMLWCSSLYAADQSTAQSEEQQISSELLLPPLDYSTLEPLLLTADTLNTGQYCLPMFCESDRDCPCSSCGDDSICL